MAGADIETLPIKNIKLHIYADDWTSFFSQSQDSSIRQTKNFVNYSDLFIWKPAIPFILKLCFF